jgi:hypothetical protein
LVKNVMLTRFIVFTALALMPSFALYADGGAGVGPEIVALVVPLDSDAEAFSTVASGALGLRLDARGVTSDIRSLPFAGGTQPDNAALIRQVGSTAAGAVLICRLSLVGDQMNATMDWQDIPKGVHAQASGKQAQVDLSLDRFILRVLDSLLGQVGDRIDKMAAMRKEAVAAADKAAADRAAADKAAADKAAADKAAADKQNAVPPILRPTIEDDPTPRRFLLSTGFAPFIAIGEASSYLSLGYMITAVGNVAFQTPSGRFGAGISLGVVSFTAQGAPGTSTVLLVPMGLDASYRLGSSTVVGVLFDLSGGAALLLVSSPTLGTRAKTVPYVSGAIGVELLFSRTVGLVLDAGYGVYFEMPLLIMGVSPALQISLRI